MSNNIDIYNIERASKLKFFGFIQVYVVTQTIYQIITQSTDKSFSGNRTVTLDYYFIVIVGQITFYGAVDRHRIKRLVILQNQDIYCQCI